MSLSKICCHSIQFKLMRWSVNFCRLDELKISLDRLRNFRQVELWTVVRLARVLFRAIKNRKTFANSL